MKTLVHVSKFAIGESRSHSVGDFDEAVATVNELLAAEVGVTAEGHTMLLTHGEKTERAVVLIPGLNALPSSYQALGQRLFDMGYNVVSVALPYQGLADRMTTQLAKVNWGEWTRYADEVVDIGHGLGKHLTVAGISLGGLITGWVAQQRKDVDRAILISPGYAVKLWPESLDAVVWRIFATLPNMYLWEDKEVKADYPAYFGYPRFPTKAVVQIIRFHMALKAMANKSAPAARDVVVITNAGDPDLDNRGTNKVVADWRRHGAQITTYEFPKDLNVGHDIIDPRRPDARVDAVYPVLLDFINA